MKLYLTSWVDYELPDHQRNKSQYTGTQADYKALEKHLKSEFMATIKTREAEVPTDKPNLINFLNS